jgi:hypothetical protein
MPRRKATEVEILPAEDDQSTRGRKRLVEAEHTIKYSAPVPVTVEEEPEEEEPFSDVDVIETEKKQKRKTAKTERDELRKKMMVNGVTAASALKLIIERYAHSDGPDSGTTAEKSHCTKYGCDEAHILNQDYMNVAARWGAGRYWFTLYKDGTIVTQWEKRLEPPRQPNGPVIQSVNPNDPNSPQVIYQANGDGQTQQIPMSIKDIMKTQREALKEQLEMAKLMREAYGFAPEQPQQPKSEEEILASAILKQPDVIENVVGSVIKRFGGKGGDDEPWYADVVRDAVKSGQAAQIVQVAIDRIFNGFQGFFPGRQQNGQPSTTQTQTQTEPTATTVTPEQHLLDSNASVGDRVSEVHSERTSDGVSAQTPEEQTLAIVLNNCARKVPAQITADQVLKYADLLNDRAPQYSVDGYLEMFAKMPADAALEFVKAQPNGEHIANLEWAKDYTEQLQKLIAMALQEGEE